MKKIFACLTLVLGTMALAQTGIGTVNPDPSAILDLTSTNKGLLLPRVANTAAIANPVDGLFIYDMSCSCFRAYANGLWSGSLNAPAGNLTSNGSAIVSAYICNTASTGMMTVGTPVSGVTQTITATVTTVGTYNITATANGVIFSGSGTFAGTGDQAVVLTAIGTPTAFDTNNFLLNVTPNCNFNRNVEVTSVTSSTGKVWMDRNLGASQVATSSTDAASYGDLYQWGRLADGHQKRTSGTTTTRSSGDVPGNGNFITTNFVGNVDWRLSLNNNLWQGLSGANNPCPSGYRLPTDTELDAERLVFSSNNAAGAFNSVLKLPAAGNRLYSDNVVYAVGVQGNYWSSTVSGSTARIMQFNSFADGMTSQFRAYGFSVRCIKN